jgi:hypothetical protein
MPRRFAPLLALFAIVAIAACNAAPTPPPLTDPKEILTRTVLSLKDVKTIDAKGDLSGTFAMQGSSIDLKGTTFEFASDVVGKKVKLSASIPSFLNTGAEAIVVDQTVYYKVTGPLAVSVGADPSGKYKKIEGVASGTPSAAPSASIDPLKAIDEFNTLLTKLPAPTKGANEKIGDQDCYHITMKATSDELKSLAPSPGLGNVPGIDAVSGAVTVDIWSRVNDLRPAKIAFGIDAGAQGNLTLTFNMTYDSGVSIAAPPADQIAP